MAKLKLKLDEIDYLEGTPEELADFVRILEQQHRSERPTEVKNIEKEKEKPECGGDIEQASNINERKEITLKDIELIEYNLPREEEVINYITSKELFEHNTIELQEKFLNRRLPVRENPTLYSAFDNIVRKARKHIADQHNIIWDNRERKSYGSKTHVTVYKIKKPESGQKTPDEEILVTPVPIQPTNKISIDCYRKVTDIPVTQ